MAWGFIQALFDEKLYYSYIIIIILYLYIVDIKSLRLVYAQVKFYSKISTSEFTCLKPKKKKNFKRKMVFHIMYCTDCSPFSSVFYVKNKKEKNLLFSFYKFDNKIKNILSPQIFFWPTLKKWLIIRRKNALRKRDFDVLGLNLPRYHGINKISLFLIKNFKFKLFERRNFW